MLHRILPPERQTTPSIPIADASFPHPFPQTLEYSPAARGTWNIVHTGMLVPEAHQIYICAAGCLRGVILTAAEMGEDYRRRFHTLELHERDLYATDQETFLIDGITAILRRLDELPPAVLVFTACVHHFLGCNLPYVYRTLRDRFPAVQFAECIMDPIRQTKAMPPETRERLEIYRLLCKPTAHDNAVNMIGSNLALDESSDIKQLLKAAGIPLRDITQCASYNDFQQMGKSTVNLYTNPFTKAAAEDLEKRLGQPYLYLPQVWTYEELECHLERFIAFFASACHTNSFGVEGRFPWKFLAPKEVLFPGEMPLHPTSTSHASRAELLATLELRFNTLKQQLEGRSIAIDFTFTFLPFSLARLLLSHGLHVTEIYADVIAPDDEPNFRWLQENAPDVMLFPTKHPAMRTQPRSHRDEKGREPIALGQKATYFTGTHHFVSAIEGGGHYGFEAIHWLQTELSKAALLSQDPEPIIKKKAWGAPSCI